MTPLLMVATPCPGGEVSSLYARSVLNLQRACLGHGDVRFDSVAHWADSLTTRAKQGLITQFLGHPDATHLLFIDPGVGFWPDQVFRLLKFDAEVAAAAVPRKGAGASAAETGDPTLFFDFKFAPPYGPGKDGFVQADTAGTGFMLLKRSALRTMAEKYPDSRYRSDLVNDPRDPRYYSFALFNCLVEPGGGRFLDADESFCRRWIQTGGEIWVDLENALKGVGPVVQGTANYGSRRGAPLQ